MRDERAYLHDILTSARMIQQITSGKTFQQFQNDLLLHETVLRRLGIIGEAANKLSPESRQIAPEIPWDQIVSMRNVLVHVYFGVKLEIVWNTVCDDIPPLLIAAERIMSNRYPPS
jgi:uncharacterized protein with HEPN domain